MRTATIAAKLCEVYITTFSCIWQLFYDDYWKLRISHYTMPIFHINKSRGSYLSLGSGLNCYSFLYTYVLLMTITTWFMVPSACSFCLELTISHKCSHDQSPTYSACTLQGPLQKRFCWGNSYICGVIPYRRITVQKPKSKGFHNWLSMECTIIYSKAICHAIMVLRSLFCVARLLQFISEPW